MADHGNKVGADKKNSSSKKSTAATKGDGQKASAADTNLLQQRAIGNQRVQAQTKLKVGPPNDAYEQEANRVADKVMGFSGGNTTPPPAISSQAKRLVQRRCAECEQVMETDEGALCEQCSKRFAAPSDVLIQTKSTANSSSVNVNPALSNKINKLGSTGHPLPANSLSFFNSRFKHDFSQVRIHADPDAAETAQALNAKAYTLGNHIAFAPGQYAPHTRSGQHLLAHELTHVVQQAPHIARAPDEEDGCYKKKYAEGQGTYTKDEEDYYIWGTWIGGETKYEWSKRVIRLWIKWRFGASVDPGVAQKIYDEMINREYVEYGITPVVGCQYTFAVKAYIIREVTPMLKDETRKKDTKEAKKREDEAGLPPPPSAQIAQNKGQKGGPGTGTGKGKGGSGKTGGKKQQKGEKGGKGTFVKSGAEYEGNKGGGKSTHPALPITIKGLNIQPIGGTGTYRASVDYSIAGRDRLSQVVEAMNWVNYHWEVYNITPIARQGLGKSFAEANKHNPISEKAEVGKMEAAGRRFERVGDELIEDTETSIHGLLNPEETSATGDMSELLLNAYANKLNLELLPVSAIIDYGGWAIGAFADLLSMDSQEREIPWPKTAGIYMIRVIAQPTPQGRNNEMIRAPSVAIKIVEVISTKAIAKEGLVKPQARIAEKQLELAIAKKQQPPDLKLIAKLEKELADLKIAAHGSTVAALKTAISIKEEMAKSASGYKKKELERQIEELRKQLALAKERETRFSKGSWRLKASFASEITGQTYPLLLQLGEREKDGSKYVFEVSDVTSKSGEIYIGKSSNREKAAWRAAKNFAGHNKYGRGYVVIHMPESSGFGKMKSTLRNAPTDTAIARKRLDDLVLALTALAIFVPGVGTAAAVLGAAIAAERLIKRWNNGTLYFDAAAITDFIGLLGAAAQGASVIGKMRVIRMGDKFALASGKVNHTKLASALANAKKVSNLLDRSAEIIDWGGIAFGNLVVLNQIMEINQLELKGAISHAEARRRRATTLAGAIHENGLQILSTRKAKKTAPAELPAKAAGEPVTPSVKKKPPLSKASEGEAPQKTLPVEAPPKPTQPAPAVKPKKTKPLGTKPKETKPAPEADQPKAETKPEQTTTSEQQAAAPPKPRRKALTGNEVVDAKAVTPDKLHVITVLEDGRIIRCSMSCGEIRLHYAEFFNLQGDSPLYARAQELSGKLAALEKLAVTDDPAQKQAVADKTAALEPDLRALAADSLASEFSSKKSATSMNNLLKVFSPDEIRQLQTDLGITDLTKLGKPGKKEGSVQDRTLRLLSKALSLSSDPETRNKVLETVAGKRLTKKVETALKTETRAIERRIEKRVERRAQEAKMSTLQAERARLVKERDQVRKERQRLEAESTAAEKARVKYFHLSTGEKDPAKRREYRNKQREAVAKIKENAEKLNDLDSDSVLSKDIRKLDKQIELLDIILNPESHRAWLPCFAAGTQVETPEGSRPIESLSVGDYVMSYDLQQDEVVARRVMETFQNITTHFYDIETLSSRLSATGRHPFWIEDQQAWLSAQQLHSGMQLKLSNGDVTAVQSVIYRPTEQMNTYNLLIEQHHNYFVGDGILVHNGGEGGAIDLGMGKLLIYRGTNPDKKFAGKVYIGQSDDLDREGEHRKKAEKELKRSDLTPAERYFWEFMSGVKLEPVVTGLDKSQADYLEQRNMEIEIKLSGGKSSEINNLTDMEAKMRSDTVLMNRRRELTSSLESVTKTIKADARVHKLGFCLD